MMIHLALDDLPEWSAGEELRRFAYVHIAPSLDQMARTYQQAMAGLLPSEPVLVVGQPTRGVDIGAIEFIHNQIIKMRDAGKAILLVSVELDEIRSLSDRILVMFDGKIVGEADPATATEGELGLMMAGMRPEPAT